MRTALISLVALVFAAPSLAADPTKADAPPNIVLILADDLGYGDLGCYGNTEIKTPALDRLAREGTRYTSFCVAQAVCTASRAALLSGCYSNRIGMAGALNHTSTVGLSPKDKLLSEMLAERGYVSGCFGKWHLGRHPQFLPTKRGFAEFAGLPYSNDNGPLHPVTKGIPPLPWYEGESVEEVDPDQSQFTRRLTDRAVAFIEKNKARPFFLYVPHIMPHVPVFASEKFKGKSAKGIYGDAVEELDASVAEIAEAIDKNGLAERTIFLFASDNGPFLSYGDHAGTAGRLRGGKLTAFEGGVRVPFLVRWPGKSPAGRVSDELMTSMDLCATLAHLAGAKPPAGIDGVNLAPLVLGEANARGRELFWYYSGDELQAVREGDWKLHLPHEYLEVRAEPGRGGKPSGFGSFEPLSIEVSGIRGIASRHGYRVEKIGLALYNLKDDVGETKNVADAHPEIVARLEKRAKEARDDLGDSLAKVAATKARAPGDARPALPAGVVRQANLEFAAPGGRKVLLDLYLPAEKPARPLPVVLWIHGGGWKAGSKENCPLVWMAAEGYAIASVDYRLLPEARWPAQRDDCQDAVRWLRANAGKYGLDPAHVGVAGGSAGGHLAALLGTLDAPADPQFLDRRSCRVQAVLDLYGPSDLLSMPNNLPGAGKTEKDLAGTNGAKLLGGAVHTLPDLAKQASALYQVSAGDSPFLILHGDKDPLVPLDQSERLAARLREAKVESELVVLPGAGHGGKEFGTPEINAKIKAFFDKHLKP